RNPPFPLRHRRNGADPRVADRRAVRPRAIRLPSYAGPRGFRGLSRVSPAPAVSDRFWAEASEIETSARQPGLRPVSLTSFQPLVSSRPDQAQAAAVDLDAHALAGAERHLVHVVALGTRRLGLHHGVDKR